MTGMHKAMYSNNTFFLTKESNRLTNADVKFTVIQGSLKAKLNFSNKQYGLSMPVPVLVNCYLIITQMKCIFTLFWVSCLSYYINCSDI